MQHYYGDVYLDRCEVWASPKEFMNNYRISPFKFIKWAFMRRDGEPVINYKFYYDKRQKKLLILVNEDEFLYVWHDENSYASEQLFEHVYFRSMQKENSSKLLIPNIKGCFRRLDGLPFFVWDQAYIEALYHGDYV